VRLRNLIARGYRNLADLEREAPPRGVAVLGANAQGKTNLLEAICYPVLFRSFRGAPDQQVTGGSLGFHVEVQLEGSSGQVVAATYQARKKRITVDGEEIGRLSDAAGTWLTVAFLPSDLGLASGPSAIRRQYLDRLPLSAAGADLIWARLEFANWAQPQFTAEFDCLGERGAARLEYRCRSELAHREAWSALLTASLADDRARGMTTIGPHRDDLILEIGGRGLRDYGSTGQQRSAAVALKLIEIAALREARGTEPALLLDDVFAELDRDRQIRLARRLMGPEDRQVFVTSPRADELPPNLELPVWKVENGKII
jgi:DNA replication and repair protein RecF